MCVCVCAVFAGGLLNVFTYVACGLIESDKIHVNVRHVNAAPMSLSPTRSLSTLNATNKVRPTKKKQFFFPLIGRVDRFQVSPVVCATRSTASNFFLCVCLILCRFGLCVCVCHRNYVIASAKHQRRSSRQTSLQTVYIVKLAATTTSTRCGGLSRLVCWMFVCFCHNNSNEMEEIYAVMWCGDSCVRVCERTCHH